VRPRHKNRECDRRRRSVLAGQLEYPPGTRLGGALDELYENGRRIQQFIGAADSSEIVFVGDHEP
jgi:hypothetical protein